MHGGDNVMPMSAAYRALHQRSIDDPAGFWDEQAQRIDWQDAVFRCAR